jgi:hypothetical protein
METIATQTAPRIPGVPSKPLENPPRSKPTYASDSENSILLEAVLRQVPAHLNTRTRSAFSLLHALIKLDASCGKDLARQLLFIAAVTHRTADERRTAEYLLRNRHDFTTGRRSALALILAARCAAEMDVRRTQLREAPVALEAMPPWPAESADARVDDPSVGEVVLEKVQAVTGHAPSTEFARDRMLDAVAIALELAERQALNRGRGRRLPALVAMRADARRDARLVTHLRNEYGNDVAARRVAHLLVGGDGSPIETALLWWCTRYVVTAADVPPEIRSGWVRDLRAVDAAFGADALVHPECPGSGQGQLRESDIRD